MGERTIVSSGSHLSLSQMEEDKNEESLDDGERIGDGRDKTHSSVLDLDEEHKEYTCLHAEGLCFFKGG